MPENKLPSQSKLVEALVNAVIRTDDGEPCVWCGYPVDPALGFGELHHINCPLGEAHAIARKLLESNYEIQEDTDIVDASAALGRELADTVIRGIEICIEENGPLDPVEDAEMIAEYELARKVKGGV